MFTRFSKFFVICTALLGMLDAGAAQPPRIVVNIVVGSMTTDALTRYAGHYGDGGLRRLLDEGAVFTDAHYDCMQTVAPASLATFATGAHPSTHGIVSKRWFDYTTGKPVTLTEDRRERDFDLRDGKEGHSPRQFIAPTVGDMLMRADSSSRIVTIALDPVSAITATGRKGYCFWMDAERCRWTTSSYYFPLLPGWVKSYNAEDMHARFLAGEWAPRFDRPTYVNSISSRLFADKTAQAKRRRKLPATLTDYQKVSATPIGNTVLFDFAKYAVTCMNLGSDYHPDILTLCLDTSRNVAETYGPSSIEYEDMIYRLDNDLRDFLAYLHVHLNGSGSVAVVFTAAHGSSPAEPDDESRRFNVQQFEVIMNAYLNAKYGQGEWVLGYSDRSLYLNRELIDERRLSLPDVQGETAAFALRFRGVAHALSSTMLQSSYFAGGYAQKMQNGFYPRHSGDVVVDLMPEWIEERDGMVSQSGSMFGYDTRVPLIFWGEGIAHTINSQTVDMTVVAPTTARLLGLEPLPAADNKPLNLK